MLFCFISTKTKFARLYSLHSSRWPWQYSHQLCIRMKICYVILLLLLLFFSSLCFVTLIAHFLSYNDRPLRKQTIEYISISNISCMCHVPCCCMFYVPCTVYCVPCTVCVCNQFYWHMLKWYKIIMHIASRFMISRSKMRRMLCIFLADASRVYGVSTTLCEGLVW